MSLGKRLKLSGNSLTPVEAPASPEAAAPTMPAMALPIDDSFWADDGAQRLHQDPSFEHYAEAAAAAVAPLAEPWEATPSWGTASTPPAATVASWDRAAPEPAASWDIPASHAAPVWDTTPPTMPSWDALTVPEPAATWGTPPPPAPEPAATWDSSTLAAPEPAATWDTPPQTASGLSWDSLSEEHEHPGSSVVEPQWPVPAPAELLQPLWDTPLPDLEPLATWDIPTTALSEPVEAPTWQPAPAMADPTATDPTMTDPTELEAEPVWDTPLPDLEPLATWDIPTTALSEPVEAPNWQPPAILDATILDATMTDPTELNPTRLDPALLDSTNAAELEPTMLGAPAPEAEVVEAELVAFAGDLAACDPEVRWADDLVELNAPTAPTALTGPTTVPAPEPVAHWTPSLEALQSTGGADAPGASYEAPIDQAVWNLGPDGTPGAPHDFAPTPLAPASVEIHRDSSVFEVLPALREEVDLAPHLVDLKRRAQDALIERMGTRLYDKTLTEDQLENLVLVQLDGFLADSGSRISPAERLALTDDLLNDVLRHGPIERHLQDPSVTEIMVNGLESIYVERAGRLQRTTTKFLSEAHLRQIIERIVSKVGRRIDESSPMVDARLPDGSRVNAVIPPLAVDGPSLTIRKFSRDSLSVQDLVNYGTLGGDAVQFLSACVRGRLNVIVSGGTGTGKTTLLNALSNFIPDEERIVTIEDAVELQLRQHHLVRLESRPPNVEGKGQVTIRDLVRNSLRMRPDRVIIGECRGGEALDMLQAMNTGHDGSLTTLHANGPRDAVSRLETLCLMSGMDLPIKAIREQIAAAVNLVVHIARLRDGSRRVTHVTEVVGLDAERVVLSDVFTFNFDAGLDPEGRYIGHLQATGLQPAVLGRLRDHGVEMPLSLFEAEHVTAGSAW